MHVVFPSILSMQCFVHTFFTVSAICNMVFSAFPAFQLFTAARCWKADLKLCDLEIRPVPVLNVCVASDLRCICTNLRDFIRDLVAAKSVLACDSKNSLFHFDPT